MTKPQQQLIHILTGVNAYLEKRRKFLRLAKRSAEQAMLDILIAVFLTDALEQLACTRHLERLQREKNALTAQLNRGDASTLGAATQLALIAALRTVECQRRVHHLRRLAATTALGLHERAARAFLRGFDRRIRVDIADDPSATAEWNRVKRGGLATAVAAAR